MRRAEISLALLLVLSSLARAQVFVNPYQGSVEDLRRLEQQRLEEQKALEETARREQQQVDDELARRGWPRSRESEVRKFLELQKQASALMPKPGAGSLLISSSNAQDEWAKRREDASSSGVNPTASAPTDSSRAGAHGSSAAKKSNCWIEEKPARVAMGFSRASEADARAIALEKAKGCKIVSETSCTSGRDVAFNSDGTMRRGAKFWDCRASYQCGETQQRCQNEPAAGSAQ